MEFSQKETIVSFWNMTFGKSIITASFCYPSFDLCDTVVHFSMSSKKLSKRDSLNPKIESIEWLTDEACTVGPTCTWKAYLLLKRQFKNKA